MKINIIKLDPRVDIPAKATIGSAGFDLQAAIENSVTLYGGSTILIPTGLKIHIQEPNTFAAILPRSKRGSEGLVLANLVGVMDSDYQGQWFVNLWNRNLPNANGNAITIEPLDKIAQVVFLPTIAGIIFNQVESFDHITERADGGISKEIDTIITRNDLKGACACGSRVFTYYHSMHIKACVDCKEEYEISGKELLEIKHQRG